MKTIYSVSFYLLVFLLLVATASTSFAQNVGISNSGTYTPYSGAILDLDKSGGLLPPRLTTTERNALSTGFTVPAQAEGMMIYNKTTDRYEMWVLDGTWQWKKVVNEDDLGGGSYILNQTTVQPSSDFNISGSGTIGTTGSIGTILGVGTGIRVGSSAVTPSPGDGNILMTVDDSWIGTGAGTATHTGIKFDKTLGEERVEVYVNKASTGSGNPGYIAMTVANRGASSGVGLKLSGNRGLASDEAGFIDFENNDNGVATLARIGVKNESADNDDGSFHISLRSSGTMNERLVLDNAGNLNIDGKFNSQGIQETSDARFKKNINSISNALTTVMNLEGVTYNWRTEEFPERSFGEQLEYGVIAQQIEKFVPELVSTDKNGYKSVQYSHMVPLLLEAIKEQQAIIDLQSQEIGVLKASVDAISEHVKTARD